MVTTVLLNLQILYQCISGIVVHSLETQCLQSLDPLLNSANHQIQLMSKAIVTSLHPADVNEVATLCSSEVQTLMGLIKNVMMESPSQAQISLTNLLSVVYELLKIPSNRRELTRSGAEHVFLELSQKVTKDFQPYVHELIQIISGKRDGKATEGSCYFTAQSKG